MGRDDIDRDEPNESRITLHRQMFSGSIGTILSTWPLSQLLMVVADTIRLWVKMRGYNDEDDLISSLVYLIDLHSIHYKQKGE